MSTTSVGACRGQKKTSDFLKPELQVVVNMDDGSMDVGNRTLVL